MLTADSPLRARAVVAPLPASVALVRPLIVVMLMTAALLPRLAGLAAGAFSGDEANKLRVVEADKRFDFTANAEDPMLLKLTSWASLSAAEAINRRAPFGRMVSREAALRAPNAIAGAATTGVVFLFTECVFDATVGARAALLWAFDANATAINRVSTEDTFLVFFLFLAAWLYERAKSGDSAARGRYFGRSAAAFGLMLASESHATVLRAARHLQRRGQASP